MLSATALLACIGASMQVETSAVADPSAAFVPPALDPVSVLTAMQFDSHTEMLHEIEAQAAAVRRYLAATLGSDTGSEAVNDANLGAASGSK